jgi:hypothetical protein
MKTYKVTVIFSTTVTITGKDKESVETAAEEYVSRHLSKLHMDWAEPFITVESEALEAEK